MKISQRILIPTFLIFFAVLGGLFTYSYLINQSSNRARDAADNARFEQIFLTRIQSREDLALALALQAASNPEIQQAFALRDRPLLIELTMPTYETIEQQFGLSQYQYHLTPAISFLRLHDLNAFGDDLSSVRGAVLRANRSKLSVTGLEMGRSGLGLRGITPVFYRGSHIGSVEFGVDVDENFLNQLKMDVGRDWRILITRQALETATLTDTSVFARGPGEDLFVLATTSDAPFADAAHYNALLDGQTEAASIEVRPSANQAYNLYEFPLKDYSGAIIGVVEIVNDLGPALEEQSQRILFGLIAVFVALLISSATLLAATQRTLKPLAMLNRSAEAVANGDLDQEIQVAHDQDEIGQLGQAFNLMTLRLKSTIGGLEQNVADRTRDLERRTRELETASRIAREITSQQQLDQMLDYASNLIREEFGFYHVGIFLVDDLREYAVLRAATGDAGRQMLALNHRLKIGEVGIVGFVTETGRPRVVQNVGTDTVHFRNPLLPATRSEMALPLVYGGGIIGALDVQSVKESAFDEGDVKIIQTLADQLAIAITNTRLSERARENLRELNALYQEKIRNVWKQISQEKQTEFEYDGLNISPLKQGLPPADTEQLAEGHPVVLRGHTASRKAGSTLLIPLRLQGQLIGAVGIEKDDPAYEWSQEELSVAENAAAQASLALENARLLEETQRLAAKERTIGEISGRIGGLADIEKILQTTVLELSQTLPGAEVSIQFERRDQE
jgi:GAF domain-containing protein/HAMP domain-containing protein